MTHDERLRIVFRYHDGTKHDFNQLARSLGYLDWASQPAPFRSFRGAPAISFARGERADVPQGTFDGLFRRGRQPAAPLTFATLGSFLRYALGLSAWKSYRGSRWSLRVNPSSGNLHPTEAYIVAGPLPPHSDRPAVWHYAADRHAIELRCTFDADAWRARQAGGGAGSFLIVLTSIHWRESWKYGERAFRYCQHDTGHAIGALSLSAALHGWHAALLPAWPHDAVAALAGVDRVDDFFEAELEEPACVIGIGSTWRGDSVKEVDRRLIEAVRRGKWSGRASQLSEDHVQWTFIDEIAEATRDPGRTILLSPTERSMSGDGGNLDAHGADRNLDAAGILLQRRSAVAFDPSGWISREPFLQLMKAALPGAYAPWDAVWWPPRIHLAIFVHRVTGVDPGLYMLARCADAVARLKAACRHDFSWTPLEDGLPLWLLRRGDYQFRAQRVSCDQDIAGDGFFSLGMIAEFEASVRRDGAAFYRQLFWESGVVGQVLYLEAEAAGARATGIGCFYDDPVHELLGLEGHAFQSLYHFTVGRPIEDMRLTTEPGYR